MVAAVGAGRPALCTVDQRGLPWRDAPDYAAADPHTVVVTGRAGEEFTLLDPPYGERRLPVDSFVAAWASHRKGRFHQLSLPEQVEPVDDAALVAAARDAVATTMAHLTGPVLGNSFDVNMGFSGMAKLAAELRDTRTRKGWARRFADPAAFAYARRRLVECLEHDYTAPGATRPIYADFLLEALPDSAVTAGLVLRSGQAWSALARWAEPESGVDDRRDWCDRAAELVEEALSLETEAAAQLG